MLHGRIALIVEEEFLIALDLQRMLEGLGASQALFARDALEAHSLRVHWPDIAVAIVEIPIQNEAAIDLATTLDELGIPVVLITGDLAFRNGIGRLPSAAVTVKPISEDALANAVETALASRDQKL